MAARMQRGLLMMAVAAIMALISLAGPSNAEAATTGDVFILHGIAGTTADIYVDDNRVAANAAAKQIVGPLRLAPGAHLVSLKNGDTPVVTAKFEVKAGSSIDVVAHRTADADRKPIVTVFPNDLSSIGPGKSRFVVSHVAVAPAVDVLIDGTPLLRNIASGESLAVVTPKGSSTFSVVPTSAPSDSLIKGTTINLDEGTLTRVFLIGDSSDNTMDGLLQYIKVNVVGSTTPTLVQTGDGGQAAGLFKGYGATLALWGLVAAMSAAVVVTMVNRRYAARLVIGSRHSR